MAKSWLRVRGPLVDEQVAVEVVSGVESGGSRVTVGF